MGTDIHFRVEVRDEHGHWSTVKPEAQDCGYGTVRADWPTPRNYLFFALVAGVRNGYGFAGVRTFDEIPMPIAEGRGLPVDMASPADADEAFYSYELADAAGLSNLGDHSFTWATLGELTRGLSTFAGANYTGWVELEDLALMKESTEVPRRFCGGISGDSIIKLPFDLAWSMSRHQDVVDAASLRRGQTGSGIYTEVHFHMDCSEGINSSYIKLINETWPRLHRDPESIRIIMGFDS